jgi:hypothetical protein
MNSKERFIHDLGPAKIAELIEIYDDLYEHLVIIPIQAWESEKLFTNLRKNGSMDRMSEMIDVYKYVYEVEKCEKIEQWLDILSCTGVLLEAKRILGGTDIY